MMGLPRAIWGVLGIVLLVLVALGWLHLHDARVRDTAQAHVSIAAKDDTIHVLRGAVTSLGRAIKAADSVLLAVKGSVVRIAYVPKATSDYIASLNHQLDSMSSLGGTTVPITTARNFQTQLNACTKARNAAAAAAMIEEDACARATRLRDAQIDTLKGINRLLGDQLTETRKLVGLSTPRFTPFAATNYSLTRKTWDAEGGTKMRLFAGFHARALLRVGNLGDSVVVMRDSLAVRIKHSWDVTVGGLYEFR